VKSWFIYPSVLFLVQADRKDLVTSDNKDNPQQVRVFKGVIHY